MTAAPNNNYVFGITVVLLSLISVSTVYADNRSRFFITINGPMVVQPTVPPPSVTPPTVMPQEPVRRGRSSGSRPNRFSFTPAIIPITVAPQPGIVPDTPIRTPITTIPPAVPLPPSLPAAEIPSVVPVSVPESGPTPSSPRTAQPTIGVSPESFDIVISVERIGISTYGTSEVVHPTSAASTGALVISGGSAWLSLFRRRMFSI